MKLLHLKGKDIDEYIAIDKIERFQILGIENTIRYTVDIIVGNRPSPLAINTSEPQEIVKSLLKVINTIDNEIIEYTVKEAE
jgi:hypothetical protein